MDNIDSSLKRVIIQPMFHANSDPTLIEVFLMRPAYSKLPATSSFVRCGRKIDMSKSIKK
jgi:hypothetical protein